MSEGAREREKERGRERESVCACVGAREETEKAVYLRRVGAMGIEAASNGAQREAGCC